MYVYIFSFNLWINQQVNLTYIDNSITLFSFSMTITDINKDAHVQAQVAQEAQDA